MESSTRRQRWTDDARRSKKQPSLYDEWLNEERMHAQAQTPPATSPIVSQGTPAQGFPYPLRRGDTAATSHSHTSGATIRTVSPDRASIGTTSNVEHVMASNERGTSSFERAFLPITETTIIGGPAAMANTNSPPASMMSGRSRRDRERERDWDAVNRGSPSSHNGSVGGNGNTSASNGKGMLSRSTSRSNGDHAHAHGVLHSSRDAYSTVRPRTRTLDERRTRDHSPSTYRHRHRIGSVNTPGSPPINGPGDYLASVPAATSPPSAPSISSLGSPVQAPVEMPSQRSISPISSSTADSIASSLPSANVRRILHLMKTLNGRMSGNVMFRRNLNLPWSQAYCYIKDETGSLMYEIRGGDSTERVLLPNLRGCKVNLDMDGETPYLEVTVPRSNAEAHIKLSNQADFDSWFAALLCWQPIDPKTHRSHTVPTPINTAIMRPEPPPRISSARSASAQGRDRADSERSNRRKSVVTSLKEAPVIKIGKMIFWDTNVTYNNTPTATLGQPATGRPQAFRMQSYGSRRWRRISGQLRENGELKLHSDADNSLISVVQLSQLSRCAIQRLDPTVLDNEFCIAIYPQYTSSQSSNVSFLRPIFLTLENRVLYEVWFVLLRAFTIPQLYGPQLPEEMGNGELDSGQGLENMLTTSTSDMFRMERALHIRVVEAKMYPPTSGVTSPETGFSGGHGKNPQIRPEQYGYHVEVLLDGETRGKTVVKYEGLSPLWGETFEFMDLPPVLTSASVVVKRRPPDYVRAQEQQQSKLVHEAYGFSDQNGGYSGITFDATCGKVEIYLEELAAESEVEKWWPVVNMYNQRVGEVLIKARAEEGVILMARDYRPLNDVLHRFSNGLTLQIAQMIPNDLKRLSDCLLNIFQVSGRASDWLMALVEDEIDSVHKETPLSRIRYRSRKGSNDANSDNAGMGHSERELLVRDMNKNATLEANLLFRGNTLLTKSLDSHMRRIGRDYLEQALSAKLKELNDKDPDCEVDPNRAPPADLERNWRRLMMFTQEVWKSIVAAKAKCPVELRRIFRHIRACAEDRYGDYLRSVSYSSVSGFLFLRFFCPAVLNPKLFGLLKDDIKPRARRALTLIAKSLQTLANMASFGTKEHWMEPMNQFLTQHRESFKTLIDDVCYVPAPLGSSTIAGSASSSPSIVGSVVSAEQHLSYTTPMTIMQRLPPTSREGFPSLPYLIDQARAFADLIELWLESTSASAATHEIVMTGKPQPTIASMIEVSDGDLKRFNDVCASLHARTQECLSRAERAERPNSALSFRWEDVIDQLQSPLEPDEGELQDSPFGRAAERIASDPTIAPPSPGRRPSRAEGLVVNSLYPAGDQETDEDENATRMYESTPTHSETASHFDPGTQPERPATIDASANGSLGVRRAARDRLTQQALQPQARHSLDSIPSSSANISAGASNVSSTVSSDTEHTTGTTALPNYEREVLRHREVSTSSGFTGLRERRQKDRDKEKDTKEKNRRVKAFVPALRKKKDKEKDRGAAESPG